jgi:hypothetical protein
MGSSVTMTVGILGIIAALFLTAFVALFFRLASRFEDTAASPSWLDEFSVESYAPMERLLDASDFEFLAGQPGYRPETGKRLLAERRRIFRDYLKLLVADFNRLHYFARLMLVHSPHDRPGLARELFVQQIRFYFAVYAVRCKVALYPLGWTPVDVPRLLHALERMRDQIGVGVLPPATGATI